MMKQIQLAGFDKFSEEEKQQVMHHAERVADKYSRIFGEETLKMLKLSSDKLRERGQHVLSEVKGQLDTTHGLFYAVHQDWKILAAVDKVASELERQFVEKKEKMTNEIIRMNEKAKYKGREK
jgi:ribosome-associated translation inhibitor RaiA